MCLDNRVRIKRSDLLVLHDNLVVDHCVPSFCGAQNTVAATGSFSPPA